MEELNTNLTVQQMAAPESPIPQKPPVPLRDRVLAFALLALGYLVCRFQIHDWPLLGLGIFEAGRAGGPGASGRWGSCSSSPTS